MKSNVKIAPKSNIQTPVAVSEVAEELPATAESTASAVKTYESVESVKAKYMAVEELTDFGAGRAKVCVSKNGKTFLRTRRNGATFEVYEADEGLVFPDGLVQGAIVNVRFDVRTHDAIETKTLPDGRVYHTLFAVNCEVVD